MDPVSGSGISVEYSVSIAATARSSFEGHRRYTVAFPTPACAATSSTVVRSNPRCSISSAAAAVIRASVVGSRGRPRPRRTGGSSAVVVIYRTIVRVSIRDQALSYQICSYGRNTTATSVTGAQQSLRGRETSAYQG